MTAGIKLYNGNRQVIAQSNQISFGLAQKLSQVSQKPTQPILQLGTAWKYRAIFDFDCTLPLVVLALGDINNRSALISTTVSNATCQVRFLTESPIEQKLFVYDIPSRCTLVGSAAMRIYRDDGELAFDSRLGHLSVVGEALPETVLDPNKKYGLLFRSRPALQERQESWTSGGRLYVRQYTKRQIYWIDNNRLKTDMVQTREYNNWYVGGGFGVIRDSDYNQDFRELLRPLLIDITNL